MYVYHGGPELIIGIRSVGAVGAIAPTLGLRCAVTSSKSAQACFAHTTLSLVGVYSNLRVFYGEFLTS